MAQWNQTDKTLQTKIVYWGAALCGKTTNLQQIHAITDPREENRLISLNTASDRLRLVSGNPCRKIDR